MPSSINRHHTQVASMSQFVLVLITFGAAVDLLYAADPISVKWCYTNNAEKTKCEAMKPALEDVATKLGLTVQVGCVDGSDIVGCMSKIKNNEADLVNLKGLDIYDAGRKYDMSVIVKEVYKDGKKGCYSVAVVKKTNASLKFSSLHGKKTCHPGARSGPGWVIPVGYMMLRKFITPLECSRYGNLTGFVSAAKSFNQSCVPGVSKFNTTGDIPSNLCEACKSNCTTTDEYSGYEGAFKCMAEGAGDVAFVMHTTTQQMVDKGHGSIGDYEYLCTNGKREAIGNHETCFVESCPAPAVMTRRRDKNTDKYVELLVTLSAMYGINQTDPSKFQLFNSTTEYGQSDVLFRDSAVGLKELPMRFYYSYLQDERFADKANQVTCVLAPPPTTSQPFTGTVVTTTSAGFSVSRSVSFLLVMAIVALVKAVQ